MARAVLDQVRDWFEEKIFVPLRTAADPQQAIADMSREVAQYFISRERVCLFAAITLGEEQETFATSVRAYFSGWVDARAGTLRLTGLTPKESATRALDAVAAIQGRLILCTS